MHKNPRAQGDEKRPCLFAEDVKLGEEPCNMGISGGASGTYVERYPGGIQSLSRGVSRGYPGVSGGIRT